MTGVGGAGCGLPTHGGSWQTACAADAESARMIVASASAANSGDANNDRTGRDVKGTAGLQYATRDGDRPDHRQAADAARLTRGMNDSTLCGLRNARLEPSCSRSTRRRHAEHSLFDAVSSKKHTV